MMSSAVRNNAPATPLGYRAEGLVTRVVIALSADADYAKNITDPAANAGWRTAAKYDELFERLYDHLADLISADTESSLSARNHPL
jgi:hypothetical protein